MRSLTDKLLAIVIALLVGLSPLQVAMAAIAVSAGQQMATHQMMDSPQAEMGMAAMSTSHDCEQTMNNADCTTHDCSSHQCSSNHCASCVFGIIPEMISTLIPALTFESIHADGRVISQLSSSPFRPPRG